MITVTVVFGALAGLIGGNAVPHFVRGITKQRYPCVFGSGPVVNLFFGWLGLVLAGICFVWIDLQHHPVAAMTSLAGGVLAIGLFHAHVGAFGKQP